MAERPSVYFHVEFGVSWTPKHRPKAHHLTFASKSMRGRPDYPRKQLPPPPNAKFFNRNDNSQPQQQQSHHHYQRNHHNSAYPVPANSFAVSTQPHHDHLQLPYTQTLPIGGRVEEIPRSSRSLSRSSHERGRSAPPVVLDSPWDAEPEPLGATALPTHRVTSHKAPQIQKDIPTTPNSFLFGADGMPLSPELFFNTASNQDTQTEYPRRQRKHESDLDRGKAKEMASLASALMTVDNGFEDQWWYQGDRMKNLGGEFATQTNIQSTDPNGLGWAVASNEGAEESHYAALRRPTVTQDDIYLPRSADSSLIDIVSPLSGSESPASGRRTGLRRSATVASEERYIYR